VLVRSIMSEGKLLIVYMQSDSQMLNARLRRYAESVPSYWRVSTGSALGLIHVPACGC